jgi:hypothetical protein
LRNIWFEFFATPGEPPVSNVCSAMKTLVFTAALSFFMVPGRAQESPSATVPEKAKSDQPAAFLGISTDTSRGDGVRVDYVQPGSPAARAGVEAGAVIFGICGKPVNGVMAQVSEVVSAKKPGEEIELRWCRNETVKIAKITLGSRTEADRTAEGKERERFTTELKERRERRNKESETFFSEKGGPVLTPWPEEVAEKRARLEEELRKLEQETRDLEERTAKLRAELQKLSR